MIFNVLSLFALAAAVVPNVAASVIQARAAPVILYPRTGTTWHPLYDHNVTWVAQPGTASLEFIGVGNSNRFPLKSGVDLTKGRVEVVVPNVQIGDSYLVRLHVTSASKYSNALDLPSPGTTSDSGVIAIADPESPAPSAPVTVVPSTTTVVASQTTTVVASSTSVVVSTSVAVPSTSSVTSSSISSVASSSISSVASSSISSVASSSATTVVAPSITTVVTSSTTTIASSSSSASSVASSVSSAVASISSSLSSAQSSISASASSAVASATSISRSASSAASSASASASSSAALGAKGFADAKFGVLVTAGLVVFSTLAGASLF